MNGISYTQNTDSSAIILESQDTIIKAGTNKSLINPRNLELKQKNYWELYAEKLKKPVQDDSYEESLYKPMISLGLGRLSFFGDVGDTMSGKNNPKRSPFQGGFPTIRLINPINDYLDVAFYAMLGSTSVNQTTPSTFLPSGNSGLGFRSTVKSGGITFNYNFNQFLKRSYCRTLYTSRNRVYRI